MASELCLVLLTMMTEDLSSERLSFNPIPMSRYKTLLRVHRLLRRRSLLSLLVAIETSPLYANLSTMVRKGILQISDSEYTRPKYIHIYTHTTAWIMTLSWKRWSSATPRCWRKQTLSFFGALSPVNHKGLDQVLNTNFTLSPSYSFHKSSHHKLCFLSLYIYSAGTQHGNLHPAG